MLGYVASSLVEDALRNVPGCFMSAIQRMIDEMQRRGYASKTIQEYSGSVRRLATYFGCCPSQLTLEQVREYQVSSRPAERHFCQLLQRDGHGPAVLVPPDARPGLVDRSTALRSARASLAGRAQSPGSVPAVASAPSAEASVAVDDGLLGGLADFRTGSSARGRPGRQADARSASGKTAAGANAWSPIRPLSSG